MTQVDEIGINAPAVHALWTIHGLNALNGTNKEATGCCPGGAESSGGRG